MQSIAAKIATFEQELFKGDHTMEIMAARGCLQYDAYGSTTSSSSVASVAAATSRQMTSNTHGNAHRLASSLLTSYRLLDVLADLLGCHQDVQRHAPATIPRVPGEPTYLIKVGCLGFPTHQQ